MHAPILHVAQRPSGSVASLVAGTVSVPGRERAAHAEPLGAELSDEMLEHVVGGLTRPWPRETPLDATLL